jgi:hypothetical protein
LIASILSIVLIAPGNSESATVVAKSMVFDIPAQLGNPVGRATGQSWPD